MVPVAFDVAKELDRAQAGEVPSLAGPFDRHGARSDPALREARDRLVATVEQTITRAFRPAFLFSAALAAAALGLAAILGSPGDADVRLNPATGVLLALLAGGLLLIGVEAARGRGNHPPRIADPCLPRALPAASGIDATVQEVVLAGLDRAACRLGTSREALVLSIAGSSAGGGPRWTRATVTAAVRAGLLGSLAEAARRGDVPSFAVPFFERVIRATPIDQLVRGGFSLQGLFG